MSESADPRCAFCGKSKSDVRKLIAGPTVFICDACVARCSKLCEAGNEHLVKSAAPRVTPRSHHRYALRRCTGALHTTAK